MTGKDEAHFSLMETQMLRCLGIRRFDIITEETTRKVYESCANQKYVAPEKFRLVWARCGKSGGANSSQLKYRKQLNHQAVDWFSNSNSGN